MAGDITQDDEPVTQMHEATENPVVVHYVVSYELYQTISKYTELVIFPILAIVGFVGNALSGVIMVKSGLNKPSNILLLGLAVGDFLFLFGIIDIPRLLMYNGELMFVWRMQLDSIIACYYILMVFYFIGTIGSSVSISVTIFITIERIIAVYFPLRFSRLVTPARTKFVTVATVLASMVHSVIILFRIKVVTFTVHNELYGVLSESNPLTEIRSYYTITMKYMTPIVSPILVTLGCVIIGVKIKMTLRQRKMITSATRKTTSSARMRTLFMVCFLFSVTRICHLFVFIPVLGQLTVFPEWLYASNLYSMFLKFLLVTNNCTNFFVYVAFNPKFRKLIVQSLCDFKIRK